MPKLRYSNIFNDYYERIYRCFFDPNFNIINEDSLLSNLKFHKGNSLDEENAEFSFCWKNYYNIHIVVEKVYRKPNFAIITHKSINIDKLPFQISLIFNLYWDSINENAVYIF